MEVKIIVPKRMVQKLEREFKSQLGRKPTQDEIVEFFQNDMITVYDSEFEDGLAEAVECQFAD